VQFDTRMLDKRRFVDFHFCSFKLASPSPDPTPLQNYITELKLTTTHKSALYISKIKLSHLPSGKHAMLLTLKHSCLFADKIVVVRKFIDGSQKFFNF